VTTTSQAEAAATTSAAAPACADDSKWADKDGDGCSVYAEFIAAGKLTQKQACEWGGGDARTSCKKTCGMCEDTESSTPPPPVPPREESAPPPPPQSSAKEEEVCEDSECVESWRKTFGKCIKCDEFKDTYCGKDALFMQSCPKSCKLCSESGSNACADDFNQDRCEEWRALDFCDQPKVVKSCKKTCGLCEHMAASIEGGQEATLEGGASEAVLEAVADEKWEYGSKQALKKPAKETAERKGLRPVQSAALRCSAIFGSIIAIFMPTLY